MDKMMVLLEQLHIDESAKELANGTIEKVIIKQDQFYFFISLDHLLPYEEYSMLLTHRTHFPYPMNFTFDLDKKVYLEKEVLNYLGYYITDHLSDYPELSSIELKNCSVNEDQLKIGVINQLIYDTVMRALPSLQEFLSSLGIELTVKIYFIENKEVVIEKPPVINIDLKKVEPPKKKEYSSFRNSKYNDIIHLRIEEINQDFPRAEIQGYVFKVEMQEFRSGKCAQNLYVTDYTDSIILKRFENKRVTKEMLGEIKKGDWVKAVGEIKYDSYAREIIMMPNTIEKVDAPSVRSDHAEVKRVELHTHTKMSTMDGIGSATDYINQAIKWGHKAIAITDHGNVQSFPECQIASKANSKIKVLYGCEMNMIDPTYEIVMNAKHLPLRDATIVSFDLETTGFSAKFGGITEFGAVKLKNGEEIDRLDMFINPGMPIPPRVTKLTHITNEMVKDAPTIEEALPKIKAFFGEDIIAAHNANFDIGFLNENCKKCGFEPITNPLIDSLALARAIMKPMKSYRLGSVCRFYKVSYDDEVAHRADYDAEVLGSVLNLLIKQVNEGGYDYLDELNLLQSMNAYKVVYPYHVTVLVKNRTGLKNLFKLVSKSCTEYFEGEARIPREIIEEYRDGLLIGSSCYKSDVFEATMNSGDEKLEKLMQFYDYIEIQPFSDYYHLVDRGSVEDVETLTKMLVRYVNTAKKLGKMIVATGDVHFLNPEDKIFRDVFIANPTIGINHKAHPLCNRRDPTAWTPSQYFRTTDEMLKEYPYLSPEETYEYVVTNTNKIADMIDGDFNIVHDQLFTPKIDGVEQKLTDLCHYNAHRLYGEVLPEIVEKRLEKELSNIIKHGFAVIYYIAYELVKHSNDDGYLVGSRGSVGSSFVATMADITEVNPLPPHYICLNCQYSEFVPEGTVASGYDLPDKICPRCGKPLKGDGHNIPFETFLGFNADKVPDIDLNFSGDYQWKAHEYTQVLFGEDRVYRAGTISTVADKTAYGYAKGYFELLQKDDSVRSAELERIAEGCTGVKRTSGQHPGGIIVIPNYMDVYDFTPIQYPADDMEAAWKTTHFDFHAIHDNVLKLDILGHVDPTVTRMLQDLTGINPKDIPTNDQDVMSLFTSSKAMGIDLTYIGCNTGSLGLPEFGTPFARQMLDTTQPKHFSDLLIISGLSHGTDVYLGNADELIKSGTCTLQEVIGCRDDIMVYLIEKGLPNKDAFDIMECVRKGKSPKVFPEKGYAELMKKHNVPQWYIDSCLKIKYMFPKAHAAAYVLSAIRVAWWKLYYPREYYAVYFTTRCDAYDIENMIAGKSAILNRRAEIEKARSNRTASNKDEALFVMFDICLEMFDRGYHFNNISLAKSDSSKFTVDPDDPKGILPPFTSVDGLGASVGDSVVEARNKHPFLSKEDVTKRTRLSNTHMQFLEKLGVFDGMTEENQLSLF